ncbi:flavin reductase family protein [Microbispora sp. NBC_01189]|uniref:flavin reductase family protein n=1 Tax=Microbispora sp. NBC_01189 TaxID=2903583 RepID=UPI002E117608|nr:flavin reductase family protein [Microbispora sp. NBC_01189]
MIIRRDDPRTTPLPHIAPSVGADTFREAMAQMAAPLTVLTCYAPDGRMCGLTVNAVCSVSLSPPMLLVCLSRANLSHDAVVGARELCLHVLEPGQQDLALRFASPVDRFRGLDVHPGAAPELTDVRLRVSCEPAGALDGGDHTILLGRVVRVVGPDRRDGGGLVWHHRGAARVSPMRPVNENIGEKFGDSIGAGLGNDLGNGLSEGLSATA